MDNRFPCRDMVCLAQKAKIRFRKGGNPMNHSFNTPEQQAKIDAINNKLTKP